MALRIGGIGIDTNDLAGALAFWREVTGYEVDSQGDSYAFLVDPAKSGAGIGINVVPEPRVGKNRLHLDLYTDNLNAEAARVESLGAVRVARHGEDDAGWIVYEDTDGNQFCVCAA